MLTGLHSFANACRVIYPVDRRYHAIGPSYANGSKPDESAHNTLLHVDTFYCRAVDIVCFTGNQTGPRDDPLIGDY